MKIVNLPSGFAAVVLLLPVPAMALPDDAADLQEIVTSEYGGDANAYVADKDGDFRRMGCRDRVDLVQQLLDDGLVLADVRPFHLEQFYDCATRNKNEAVFALVVEPRSIEILEQRSPVLSDVVARDNYAMTLALLQNGAERWIIRDWAKTNLTGEGHLLYAAKFAVDRNRNDAIRAFSDAGFADILADARQPGFVDLVTQIGSGSQGGGGGLLGGLADLALGAALGGSPTDFLIASAGTSVLDRGEDDGSAPAQVDDLEMQRKLARYLATVEMPPEEEPSLADGEESELTSPTPQTDVLGELERLADLRDRGVLADEEFEAMKARILKGP